MTLLFGMLKIGATTLGETGGDAVSMSMNLGYLVSSLIFMAIFIVVVIAQISHAPISCAVILDNDSRHNDGGRFCRPVFGHWLCRWHVTFVLPADDRWSF